MFKSALAPLGYVAIVFPLAFVWHLVLFEETYRAFGYFAGEPNIPIGLLTIVIQGIVLSALYPRFRPAARGVTRALQFGAFVGIFFWTSHVLALVAKQDVPDAGRFVLMESGYLTAQFGLFALWLAFLDRGAGNGFEASRIDAAA